MTDYPESIPHPKLAVMIPKDEVELAKQHHQQTQNQAKLSQSANKQAATGASASAKKTTAVTPINGNQNGKAREEQAFTTVSNNRHKGSAPSSQQSQQQQNNNSNKIVASASVSAAPSIQQQQSANVVSQEALPQRQTARSQQASVPTNGLNTSSTQTKPIPTQTLATPQAPIKISDLVKGICFCEFFLFI